jgi:hypothetical protein
LLHLRGGFFSAQCRSRIRHVAQRGERLKSKLMRNISLMRKMRWSHASVKVQPLGTFEF